MMKTIVWCVFVLGPVFAAGEVFIFHVGRKVMLDCGVGRFRQVLVWKQRNELITRINGKTGVDSKGTAPVLKRSVVKITKLEITGVVEEDAGQFVCEADGKTFQHSLLVVTTSVVPSPLLQLGSEATLQCRVKGQNQDCLVKWNRPDGQPASSEEIQLKPVSTSDGGTWQCVVTCGLKKFTENVTITVKEPTASATLKPHSSEAPYSAVTESVAHDGGVQLLGLIWWVWLALGVVSLILILLLVLAIILCQRIRRKRRKKFVRMKNVPQPLRPRKYCNCDRPTAAAKPQQGRRREKPSAPPL